MKKKRFQVLKRKKKLKSTAVTTVFFFFFFDRIKQSLIESALGNLGAIMANCILLSWIASDSKLGWTEIFQKWKGSARIARALRNLCGLNQSLALHCRGWRQEKKVPTWIFRDPGNRFCVNARSKDQCEIFRVSLHEGSTETVMWLGPCHVHSK